VQEILDGSTVTPVAIHGWFEEDTRLVPLRLFLADDHEIVRYGLRRLLESRPGWTVVGEAADGPETVAGVLTLHPDIAVLDIGMPSIDGLEAARQILAAAPQTRILILSLHDSKEIIRDVIDSGAHGYVLKTDAVRDLVAAVEAICSNQTFFTSKTADVILETHLKRMTARANGSARAGRKRRHRS
jgi:DNA-binding NarL/FixJ family response regulator